MDLRAPGPRVREDVLVKWDLNLCALDPVLVQAHVHGVRGFTSALSKPEPRPYTAGLLTLMSSVCLAHQCLGIFTCLYKAV